MRKVFSTIMVIALVLLVSQVVYAGGFGIKAGVNFANLSTLDDEELEAFGINLGTKTGAIFGFFYSFDLNRNFAIQPEIYYSQKGTQTSGSMNLFGIPITYDLSINLDYIEIPILFKYKFPTQKINFALFAGPYVALKARAKGTFTVAALGYEESEDVDLEDVKSTDFGLTFGADAAYKIGKGCIIIDLRYSLGLVEIADGSDAKNSAFTLMLGFAFK